MQGRHLWPFPYVFISCGVLWSKCMKLTIKLVVRSRDFSTCLSRSWHRFCPFSSLVFSLTFDTAAWQVCSGLHRLMLAGGRIGGGGELWLCPKLPGAFISTVPIGRQAFSPDITPQMFDSTKPLKLLPSQLLLNPCGCLGVPLVLLFLTCFVLCSVKVLLTALLQITSKITHV